MKITRRIYQKLFLLALPVILILLVLFVFLDRFSFYSEYWRLVHDTDCQKYLYCSPFIETDIDLKKNNGGAVSLGYADYTLGKDQIKKITVYQGNCSVKIESSSADILLAPPLLYGKKAEEQWKQWAKTQSVDVYENIVNSIKARDEILTLPINGQYAIRDRDKTRYELEYEQFQLDCPYAVKREILSAQPIPILRTLFMRKRDLIVNLFKLQWKVYYFMHSDISLFELGSKKGWISTSKEQVNGTQKTELTIFDDQRKTEQFIQFDWHLGQQDTNFIKNFIISYKCNAAVPVYKKEDLLSMIKEGLDRFGKKGIEVLNGWRTLDQRL